MPATAERIVLRSGKVVEGEMIQMTAETITLEVFGVPTTYELTDVASIDGEPFMMPPRLTAEPSAVQQSIAAQPASYTPPVSSRQPEPMPKKESLAPTTLAERSATPQKIERPDISPDFTTSQRNLDDALAYFEIGYIHQSLGEKERAAENYEKALEINPNLGQLFFNEALEEYYLNHYNEARDKLMRAKALFEVQEDFRMIQLVNEQIREFFQPDISEDKELDFD